MPGQPLRFIVNPASGGRRGASLAQALAAAHGADRVHGIGGAGIASAIAAAQSEGGRLIVCGGDGSVAAVLDAVHARRAGLAVGIIPLGTGNDLARHAGWRPGRADLAAGLARAPAAPLDRWLLLAPDGGQRTFYNYLSLGHDARIALRFHELRLRRPWLFRSPEINKALYGILGLGECGLRPPVDLGRRLPGACASLVLAGISRYAGGMAIGPGGRDADGRLDAYALPGGLGLGLRLAGLRRPWHLGAEAAWTLRTPCPLAAQVDGEPLRLAAGTHRVVHAGQVLLLRLDMG